MPELEEKREARLNGKKLSIVVKRMHTELQQAMAQANLYVFA